jgi:hypothetical protein
LAISSIGKAHAAPVKLLACKHSILVCNTLIGAFLVLSFSYWESKMHNNGIRKMQLHEGVIISPTVESRSQ